MFLLYLMLQPKVSTQASALRHSVHDAGEVRAAEPVKTNSKPCVPAAACAEHPLLSVSRSSCYLFLHLLTDLLSGGVGKARSPRLFAVHWSSVSFALGE